MSSTYSNVISWKYPDATDDAVGCLAADDELVALKLPLILDAEVDVIISYVLVGFDNSGVKTSKQLLPFPCLS